MKKIDLAYFAGLFDGEGSISIISHTLRERKYLSLLVQFTNTKIWPCQSLKFAFGGYITRRSSKNKKWQDSWNWVITANQALGFLKIIMPYLRLKQAEAELAIKFQEGRNKRGNRGSRGLTEAERILEETQRKLLRGMKTKYVPTNDK